MDPTSTAPPSAGITRIRSVRVATAIWRPLSPVARAPRFSGQDSRGRGSAVRGLDPGDTHLTPEPLPVALARRDDDVRPDDQEAVPEDRPRGPSGGPARRPEREREERADLAPRSPPRRASRPAPPVRPADTLRSRSSVRGPAGSGRGRSRRGTASPSPGRPASAPARGTSPSQSSAAKMTNANPASSSESVVRANATATAPTSVPSRSTAFPNHTGMRNRVRASNAFRSIRPACSAQWWARTGSAFTLASRRQNPSARRSVWPASTAASMRLKSAGYPSGSLTPAPRLTRVRALGCLLGRAPGPR